jgi:hypothetical protein
VLALDGGSNDVEGQVTVQDDSLGEVRLDWEGIARITFAPTPADVKPKGVRLYGTVTAGPEKLEGFIQWDSEECLSTDRLDGKSKDGDLSIEMGKIRSIAKDGANGSTVELKDGRRILLEGTNDVDESIRGILVETERKGRVSVAWKVFERVDFREVGRSGRGYDEYRAKGPLRGSVTDTEGHTHAGRIVFDLDETSPWEILNGERGGFDYDVPFERVRSVEPQRGDLANVVLDGGIELLLGDGQDVSENNDGVLVLPDTGPETYLRWDQVQRVELSSR